MLVRLEADEPAAVIYGALTTSGTATPAFGADAQRLAAHDVTLRARLGTARFCAAFECGEALGDAEVVPFTRAALAHFAAARSSGHRSAAGIVPVDRS